MLPKHIRKESLTINRKRFGQILVTKTGEKIAVIDRSIRDIWRGKDAPFAAQSVETGAAGWPVETRLMSAMDGRGIERLIVRVREDKALYETTLTALRAHARIRSERRRHGSIQKVLGFEHFTHTPGVVKV